MASFSTSARRPDEQDQAEVRAQNLGSGDGEQRARAIAASS
jgi:hypothetical protein